MDEKIHGLSMKDCAEIMSKDGELKAQHGEPAYKPHFHQYLASRGVDENTWAHAWNGWWTRMEADPSGQLHAKFAMMNQELTAKAHFGDVADMSQEVKEGVSLDTFAKIQAKAAAGEDMQAVVAAEGLDWATWQKGMNAWNAAMGADTSHRITMQYGQLYAKHNPAHQAQMQGQTAAIMAAHHAEREAGIDDEPEEEYEFPDMVRELSDPKPNTRWTAAHHIANRWDIAGEDARRNPEMDQAAKRAVELFNECLERHDEFTVSNAESAGKDLAMFASEGYLTPEQASDAKGNIARCLGRAREHLATLQAAFAPIADKAVPERVKMQSQIQDYTSLIEELSEVESEWDENYQAPSAGGAPAAAAAAMGASPSPSSAIAPASSSGGFLDILKKIPIIGNIIRMLGL